MTTPLQLIAQMQRYPHVWHDVGARWSFMLCRTQGSSPIAIWDHMTSTRGRVSVGNLLDMFWFYDIDVMVLRPCTLEVTS
jgi:hypothetical protein